MLTATTIFTLFSSLILLQCGLGIPEKYWEGNWFPIDPGSIDTNDHVDESKLHPGLNHSNTDLHDEKHGIKMGVIDKSCDDGKTNLTVDWNGSAADYTCFERKKYKTDSSIEPLQQCSHIPPGFVAQHYCMNTTIIYSQKIPNFGHHRPLWPFYGEYTYVPVRRWLHCLEHGAVVMLYHPCANKKEVFKLKKIVKNCMWKHLIAANSDLTQERPMVLLTWGCSLYMNKVDEDTAVNFIKSHGMKGPELMNGDGFYNLGLVAHATILTDQEDSVICPYFNSKSKTN